MVVQKYVVYSPMSCGNYIVIPSGQEYVCCREVYEVASKTSSVGVDCITLYPGFETVLSGATNSILQLPTALW